MLWPLMMVRLAIFSLFDCFCRALVPQFDRRLNYNKLFWKRYIENELVVSEMKQCIASSKELQEKIKSLEVYTLTLPPNKI